ncbi:MAG: TIM barrel protein [Rikenellaceae bacterium]
MNRRDFLQRSAALTVGAVVGSSIIASTLGLKSCAKVEDAKGKIIGLQLYSLREAFNEDVPGTLKKIANMGYKSLEAASYKDGKIYGYEPKEFKRMVEELGMEVTSGHAGRAYEADKEEEIMQWWDEAFDAHKAAGCKYIIMPWIKPGDTLEDIKECSDYFNRVAKAAKAKGLQFGFHNHAAEFEQRDGQVIMDYFIENAVPEMKFQLDVYWANVGGVNPADYIRKYGKKIALLHIKDDSIIGDSGKLDFESIFNAAYEVGIEGYYVEVEKYFPVPAEECVQKSFDFLEVAPYVK